MDKRQSLLGLSWEDKLWPPQREALAVVAEYLRRPNGAAALVRMPTGTGKTGVMSLLARCFRAHPNVLIVAPWAQLTEQIRKEIESRFWTEKIKIEPAAANGIPPKDVDAFTPTTVEAVLRKRDGSVAVCTNQTLERIYVVDPTSYKALARWASLVLVDEGHREPAPSWSEAVRQLKRPTVLFSATPYRNDYRRFNIDSRSVYRLAHDHAVNGGYIRDVQFDEVTWEATPKGFAEVFVREYRRFLRDNHPAGTPKPRAIVRCATDQDIRHVAMAIKAHGYTVLGVHEEFGADEGDFRRSVPDPKDVDAQVWIHQYKLLEGIDDPSFCFLAIYQPLGSARAVVQQIGRVVRNPRQVRHPQQYARVIARLGDRQEAKWRAYLRYEQRPEADVDKPMDKVIEDIIQTGEGLQYASGDFRLQFDPDDKTFETQFGFPLSANVFRPGTEFKFSKIEERVKSWLVEEDRYPVGVRKPDNRTLVIAYFGFRASPLLIERMFPEGTLGVVVLRMVGDLLFFWDSSGGVPEHIYDTCTRVDPAHLERLLAADTVRVSQVTLLNSDLSAHTVRRKTLTARSVSATAPGLHDHAHFCSSVSGVITDAKGESARRYVGFTRARITESAVAIVTFERYIAWIDSIAEALADEPSKRQPFFDRYALYVKRPAKTNPVHILFDIDEIAGRPVLDRTDEDASVGTLLFDDLCYDIQGNEFECRVCGRPCPVRIEFNEKRGRYLVTSKEMQRLIVEFDSGERRRNLVAYLNTHQAFRLVTEDLHAYAHGMFYKPRAPLWGRDRADRIELLDVLHPLKQLSLATSEKGDKGTATKSGWSKTSLFDFIDRKGSTGLFGEMGFEPEFLVCDDMGTERADFIAVTTGVDPRVVFIHAKHDDRSGRVAASQFHDICGQAVKNLGLLAPLTEPFRQNIDRWDRSWNGGTIGRVDRRHRRGGQSVDAKATWSALQEVVRQPRAKREVWILHGTGLEYAKFDHMRKQANPPPNVIQMLYLLQSTWNSVSAVGATLKVICRP